MITSLNPLIANTPPTSSRSFAESSGPWDGSQVPEEELAYGTSELQLFAQSNKITDCAASDLVYLAPSGVQKELMQPEDIYVLSIKEQTDPKHRVYLRSPPSLKPSQCTPLFMAAFTKRNAGCCIHTHSQWAVLITLLLEQQKGSTAEGQQTDTNMFEINNIEQIKGFGLGYQKKGNLGYHDTLRIPVIENTPFEEDLTDR
jgi:methylthioribulose-1-phosphate dehydratase